VALIIPPGFAQVVFRHDFTGDEEEMVCTIGFDVSANSGTQEAIVTSVSGLWSTWIMGFASNQLVHTYATGYFGQDGGPPAVVDGDDEDTAGGDASETLPPNSAYLVRKRTDLAGRRGRGRFYIPCPDETQVDRNGFIAGAWITAIQANLDDMHAAYASVPGGAVVPVVLHRSEGAGIEPVPTPIESFQLDGRIATQRRRMRP
jgi:hypothetical protein